MEEDAHRANRRAQLKGRSKSVSAPQQSAQGVRRRANSEFSTEKTGRSLTLTPPDDVAFLEEIYSWFSMSPEWERQFNKLNSCDTSI